jgi:hypothetical protein
MILTAYMKDKPKEKPEIAIKSTEGDVVYEFSLSTRVGIHRYVWNLQVIPKTRDGKVVKPTGMGLTALPVVFPGRYTVEMTVDGKTLAQELTINPDPRFAMEREDYQAMFDAQVEVIALSKRLSLGVTAISRIRAELGKLDKALQKKEPPPDVGSGLKEFKEKFQVIEEDIMPKGFGYKVPSQVALRGGYLSTQLLMLGMSISSFPAVPSETDRLQIRDLNNEVDILIGRLNEFIRTEIPSLNTILEANGVTPLKVPDEVVF